MTRVTNSDQLAILLRQQLSQLSRRKASSASFGKGERVKASGSGFSRVQQIAASEGFSEADVQRALIQCLLAEELGDGLMNEAKFQQLIDRVHAIIKDDPDALRVLRESVTQLGQQK